VEQAVIVHLKLDSEFGEPTEREAVLALEQKIEQAIARVSAGEFDGDEFGGHECVLFMYGPDADRLYQAIEPLLKVDPASVEGYALKRYGDVRDPKAREVRVRW
jgi:hypothetical protein